MKEKKKTHTWHFMQAGGLIQLKIRTIDDILNLDKLDQKLWIALACPVKGLEFGEDTLTALDTDKNGRVRAREILDAVNFIKKYFKHPEVIMTEGDSIPLEALSNTPFDCGHSPVDSAKAILAILGKADAAELLLSDVSKTDALFSSSVLNGDGIIPPDVMKDELSASVISDIIYCTGGSDDVSGAKGVSRTQTEQFFSDIRAMRSWRYSSEESAQEIFFLNYETDSAAAALRKVREKIDEYFLQCKIRAFNSEISDSLDKKQNEQFAEAKELSQEQLLTLPISLASSDGALHFTDAINPAWQNALDEFVQKVVFALYKKTDSLSESEWNEICAKFSAYNKWFDSRPNNSATNLSFERIDEILSSDAEQLIFARLDEEEKHPPLALASVELKKMLLLRRDFVRLLKNFVSFEEFYGIDDKAIFQCGTLYIDGRSCDLCFKVLDGAKHATMSPLSQCFLLYCDCKRPSTNEAMQIAALVSAGGRDNLLVGRNGIFYDRKGNDWDATITKIVENPINIREAFWSPYKKLLRMIQERVAKTASEAEGNVTQKMSSAVEKPSDLAKSANDSAKKFDVGTIAALSVAFTGMATVVGGLLSAFFKLGYWVPLGIVGIILAISLPSMFIAWLKLRQRNIAPILDASGWAVNGNVKINIPLGAHLTQTGIRPRGSKIDTFDPYAQKKFPIKRVLLCVILLALIIICLVAILKNPNGISGVLTDVKNFFVGLGQKFVPKTPEQ